jgi:heme exporter protein C
LAYLAFGVIFVGSVGYTWKRDQRWDRLARSAAELGFVFTTLMLITGSLWGRPIWGAWWSWDARLTTSLILWFIYLGYFMLRAYAGDRERAARYAAILGIIGAIDIPIIHQSVTWWRTLHPEPVVLDSTGPNLPDSMLATLLVSFAGFTLLFVYLMVQKWRVESVRDVLAERELTALLASPPTRAQPVVDRRIVAGGSED